MKTLFVIGTRPEGIKLAPVVLAMRADRRFRPVICATGQHVEMLEQILSTFRICPRHTLNVMEKDQSLSGSMSKILSQLERVTREENPGVVIVQGDTTSALAGSLVAIHRQIPVAHIEAGLRTHDKRHPFPEEINRRLISCIADLHLAPTPQARDNLLGEGIPKNRIFVTGNTVVDALLHVKTSIESSPAKQGRLRRQLPLAWDKQTRILVTGHRRESFGEGIRNICAAIRKLAVAHPLFEIVYPVHPNPNVRKPVHEALSGLPNVCLLEPLDYEAFVYLMMQSRVILTDSGGIQEEAPSLGKPVLVMRDATERPEAVRSGAAVLVGTDSLSIVRGVEAALDLSPSAGRSACSRNPFGDGKSSDRIVRILARWMRR